MSAAYAPNAMIGFGRRNPAHPGHVTPAVEPRAPVPAELGADPLAAVVRRAQRGDEAALVELVESQQRYVYSLALSIMRDPADAADMTQESFIRLVRGLGSYRAETRFSTWLYRLVTNTCLDGIRRRKGTVSLDDAGDDEDGSTLASTLVDGDPLGQPEGGTLLVEDAAAVRAALDRLPLAQRVALTLFYFEERRYDEIAEVLDLPLNTVKSHIRRGKERLGQLLAAQ